MEPIEDLAIPDLKCENCKQIIKPLCFTQNAYTDNKPVYHYHHYCNAGFTEEDLERFRNEKKSSTN